MKIPSPRSNKQENPSQALQKALRLHREGKLDQAALHYAAILKKRPNHSDAMHYLGVIRFQQGRLPEALDCIRAALKLNPTNASALSSFRLILGKLSRREEALASFDRALVLKPDYVEAHINRGNRAQRPQSARRGAGELRQGARSQTRPMRRRYDAKGLMLIELGRPDEASIAIEKAIKLAPRRVRPYYNLTISSEWRSAIPTSGPWRNCSASLASLDTEEQI